MIGLTKPYYLDIGASAPIYLNNTYFFYQQGAKGICVEADPLRCKVINRIRPRDKCLNLGVW